MLNAIWTVMILLAVVFGAFTGHLSDVTNAALDSAGEAISLCITMAGVVALWMGLMEIAQRAGLVRKLTDWIAPFLRFMFPRIPKGHPAEGYIATNVIANVLGLGWACTPAGLKAMEELAKLEAERGNPEYLEAKHGEGDACGGRDACRGGDRRERDTWERKYTHTAAARKRLKESGGWENTGDKQTEGSQRGRNYEFGQKGSVRHGTAGQGGRFGKAEGADLQQGTAGRGRRASNEMCIFLILNISSLQLIPVNMIAYRSQYGSANPTAIIAPAIAATLVSTLVAIVYCKIKDHSAGAGIDGSYRGSSADLTASETGRMSGGRTGFCRTGAAAGMLPGKRNDSGGKAV